MDKNIANSMVVYVYFRSRYFWNSPEGTGVPRAAQTALRRFITTEMSLAGFKLDKLRVVKFCDLGDYTEACDKAKAPLGVGYISKFAIFTIAKITKDGKPMLPNEDLSRALYCASLHWYQYCIKTQQNKEN